MKQSIRQRHYRFSKLSHLYTRIKTNSCIYCGDLCNSVDHVPSIHSVDRLGTLHFDNLNVVLLAVDSCIECNVVLKDSPAYTVLDRVKLLAKRYKKKYKSDLDTPVWSVEEIDELDYSLSSYIEQRMIIKTWIERKLSFMLKIHEVT